MESIYTELALYGSKNECARTDNVYFPISEVCNGRVSLVNMLPLERYVLKEIVLIALLQNESWNKYLMLRTAGQYPNSGRRYLLPLDGAAYLKY